MGSEVIVAFISAGVTLLVCLLNNHYQRIEADKKHAETMNLVVYRLDELTKQVEKHNSVVERTYRLERDADVMREQIKVANHRLDDLEKGA